MKRAANFVDLTGRRYGSLLVLSDTGKNQFSGNGRRQVPLFLCRCDCGNQKEISSNSLRNGSSSCGCKKGKEGQRVINSQYSQLYARYKVDADSRNLSFELTKEEFLTLIHTSCFYCNKEPSNLIKDHLKNSNEIYKYSGIDRVDNSIGYILINCVACCKECNSHKKSISKETIIKCYFFFKENGLL